MKSVRIEGKEIMREAVVSSVGGKVNFLDGQSRTVKMTLIIGFSFDRGFFRNEITRRFKVPRRFLRSIENFIARFNCNAVFPVLLTSPTR